MFKYIDSFRHYRTVTIIMIILYPGSSETTSPPEGIGPVTSYVMNSSDDSDTAAEPTASGMSF